MVKGEGTYPPFPHPMKKKIPSGFFMGVESVDKILKPIRIYYLNYCLLKMKNIIYIIYPS